MSHFDFCPLSSLTTIHDKLGTMCRHLNYIEKLLRKQHPSTYHDVMYDLDSLIQCIHRVRNTIRRNDYRITFETDRKF